MMPPFLTRMKGASTTRHRRTMLFPALFAAALGLSLSAYAGDFHLELAYCDVDAGPLLANPDSSRVLPDGCLGQLIEHTSDGAIPRPNIYGDPGEGDVLLTQSPERRDELDGASFRVNGAERLESEGYFLIDPVLEGHAVPSNRLYVRIWNAPDAAHATYYYESPLYLVRSGVQQINFSCAQLTLYPAEGSLHARLVEPGAVPLEYNVLSSYPNPFNAEATLAFALEQPSRVAISLYDIQGRRTAELMNDELGAGAHDLRFTGIHLPTGLYFATLEVNGARVSTRRMLLLK